MSKELGEKRNIRKIIRPILFLAIGAALFILTSRLLQMPAGNVWAVRTGMDLVHRNKGLYDVLEVGTSTVIANISNQELYEKYGITGVSIGEPEQPVYLSRFVLEDALRCQHPKVVILDSKAFFYTDERLGEMAVKQADYILHNTIDSIRDPAIRKKALQRAELYNSDLDYMDYFLPIYYNHENWKYISEARWRSYSEKDCMNGNVSLYTMTGGVGDPYRDSMAGSAAALVSEEAVEDLREICALCRANDAELLLTTGYVTFTRQMHDAMQELADELGIAYLDINEAEGTIGLDHFTDVADGGFYAHLNLLGAVKWTDYLGEYLTDRFSFEDRRAGKGIARFERQRALFEEQNLFMKSHLALEEALDLYDYLKALAGLDPEKHMIFAAVYDEGTKSMSEEGYALMDAVGLTQFRQIKSRENYAAAVSSGMAKEAHDPDAPAEVSGVFDAKDYLVKSGAFGFMDEASILIMGAERMQKKRGLNFVVYDRMQDRTISSVFFDTYAREDPPKQRLETVTNTSAMEVTQSAAGPNRWTDALS